MEKLKLFCLSLALSALMLSCDNKKQEGGNEGSGVGQGMENAADEVGEGIDKTKTSAENLGKEGKNDAKEMAEEANENKNLALDEDQVEFLVDAGDDGMYELEASRLAKDKATSPQVKSFADKMVVAHTKTNEELKNLAQSKNVTVPSSLSSYNKDKLEKLRELSGQEFDKEYMDNMVVAHNKNINDFQKELEDAKDTDIKNWISKTLPTLQEHLQMAQKAQYEIENSAKNNDNKSKSNM